MGMFMYFHMPCRYFCLASASVARCQEDARLWFDFKAWSGAKLQRIEAVLHMGQAW